MAILLDEYREWNTPVVGAYLLWRFSAGYVNANPRHTPPPFLLHCVVTALLRGRASKKQENYNPQELAVDFVAGATLSLIPVPGIKGLNKGQGSYLSIARSMNKKFINGSISHVSSLTTLKSFAGTSFEYGTAYGAAEPYLSDKINQGIDFLGDMMTPAENEFQILYTETLFIRATDKCGNVVELYFMQEFSNE